MEIAVIVPKESHWQAFIQDLGDLWQINKKGRDWVTVGEIRFKMINLMDPWYKDRVRGIRFERVYFYNCRGEGNFIAYLLAFFHDVEIVEIWN